MCHDSWMFGNPVVAGGYPKPTVWWTESFLAKICGLFLSLCLVLHRLQQVSNILHVDPSVPRFVPSSIVIPTGVETSESHGQQTTDFRGSNFFHWNTLEILVESFAISFHISHDTKYCNDQCTMEWLLLSTMPGSRLHQDRRVSRRDISGDGATRWKLLVLSVRLVCFSCVLERNIDVQCLLGALRCFWGWSSHCHSHWTCRQDCFVDRCWTLLQKDLSERILGYTGQSCTAVVSEVPTGPQQHRKSWAGQNMISGVWVGDEWQCIILLIQGLIYLIILIFDRILSYLFCTRLQVATSSKKTTWG